MSVHCACWKDGEPCCWCGDDTDEDIAALPACTRVFTDDCVSDLHQALRDAEDCLAAAEDCLAAAEEVKRGRSGGVPVGGTDVSRATYQATWSIPDTTVHVDIFGGEVLS